MGHRILLPNSGKLHGMNDLRFLCFLIAILAAIDQAWIVCGIAFFIMLQAD
jgi:hypothetical protein